MTDLSQIPRSNFYQSGQMKVPGAVAPLAPFVRAKSEVDEFLAGAVMRLINQFPALYGQQNEKDGVL